jgi:hypothetical protein
MLHFDSLGGLTTFSALLPNHYIINTTNLTMTGTFTSPQIRVARQLYNAKAVLLSYRKHVVIHDLL